MFLKVISYSRSFSFSFSKNLEINYKNKKRKQMNMPFVCVYYTIMYLLEYAVGLPLPLNEYAFIKARNKIKAMDTLNYTAFNAKEKIVSLYFEKLKKIELARTSQTDFYPSRAIQTELQSIIHSDLYAQLKLLPKGGNIHIHENQMLNRRQFLELIQRSPEYEYLHICDPVLSPCKCTSFYLTYFALSNQATDCWVKVKSSNWTVDAILNKTTLIGILNNLKTPLYPTDTVAHWAVAKDVFNFYSDIIEYNNTRFSYIKACLDNSLRENVQLVEFRIFTFKSLYYFDSQGVRQNFTEVETVSMLERFRRGYLEKNPEFIDFNFIVTSVRGKNQSEIRRDVEQVIAIQRLFPDLIRGYDLVGEEDRGHTLLFHSESLIKGN